MSIPEPYYQDDHATIYHGDCLDIISHLEFGVVVTDPPYGMEYRSNWGADHAPVANDETTDVRDRAIELATGKPMLVFGKWNQERPKDAKHRLIWSKAPDPGMGDLSMPWGNSDEEIYVIGSGFRSKSRQANVLAFQKPPVNAVERAHPTPKPLPLMVHLLERCPDGTILDPFMGSGSTLRAAKDLGRKSIGIEIDERYCEFAANRLAQEVLDFGGAA